MGDSHREIRAPSQPVCKSSQAHFRPLIFLSSRARSTAPRAFRLPRSNRHYGKSGMTFSLSQWKSPKAGLSRFASRTSLATDRRHPLAQRAFTIESRPARVVIPSKGESRVFIKELVNARFRGMTGSASLDWALLSVAPFFTPAQLKRRRHRRATLPFPSTKLRSRRRTLACSSNRFGYSQYRCPKILLSPFRRAFGPYIVSYIG
jgi:hypothetical protein